MIREEFKFQSIEEAVGMHWLHADEEIRKMALDAYRSKYGNVPVIYGMYEDYVRAGWFILTRRN